MIKCLQVERFDRKKYIISTESVLDKYVVLCPTHTKILERSLIYIVIAYENGADLGADYIECDVQITKVSSLLLNTSYLTASYIVFTLKMESVSKNTIFGLKMMVKSGLEKIFFKFLHAGDYFPLLHKSAQNHKFSNKNYYLPT